MADVKIPVSAELKGVSSGLGDVEQAVARTTKRLEKFKWNPIDLRAIEAELKRLETVIVAFQKRVGPGGLGLAGGGAAAPGSQMLPAPGGGYVPYTPPSTPTTRGPARRGRGAYTNAPEFYDIGQNFVGGLGNGVGIVTSYGTRGAFAGARDGGMMGGAAGLLRGLGIGALAFGALKVGQGVNEGYELAKERAGSLDSLKRQMGDVGVGFEKLKVMTDMVADGLGVNQKEAAALAVEFNKLSRGAERTPESLAGAVRVGLGLDRAYGLAEGTGGRFVAGMKNLDPRQNNRELALLLAETIERSGMNSRADEVMQAFQSFASTTSRMTLGPANLGAYAGAYGSLMSGRTPGMTGDVAEGMLAQANASVMRMGGAGEAGKNFTLTALSRYGGLDPIQAMALAEGGLFGTRRGVFGNSALAGFVGAPGVGGPNADVTNFQALRSGIMRMGGGKALQLDAAKNYFGVSSLSQAAALLGMDDTGAGNLQRNLERAGVNINDLNSSGIQALAKMGPNASADDLRAAVKAGRQETEYTKMLDELKKLEDIKINTGDKLIGPINTMRSYLGAIAEKLAPDSAYVREQKQFQSGLSDAAGGRRAMLENQLAGSLRDNSSWFANLPADRQAQVRQQRASAQAELGSLDKLSGLEAKYGLPKGMLYGMWGTESSFGKNTGPSSAGARGHFQFMPGTAKQYGVTIGDFGSEAEGAARYMADLYRKTGDWRSAMYAYNGVVNNVSAGEDYVRKVQQYGGMQSDVTPLPGGASGRGGVSTMTPQQIEAHLVLHPQDTGGKSLGPPVRTRVSLPRGAGAQ